MSPRRRSQAGLNVKFGLLTFQGMFIIVFRSFSTSLSLASISWASFIVMSPRNKVNRSWAQTKARLHVYICFSSQKQPLQKMRNNLKHHASQKCLLSHTDHKTEVGVVTSRVTSLTQNQLFMIIFRSCKTSRNRTTYSFSHSFTTQHSQQW